MPRLVKNPSLIKSSGNKPKIIREFLGRVNTRESKVSIARMTSPAGWIEPGQTPEFDEYTIVLEVKTEQSTIRVAKDQAILVHKGEWVQYRTPDPGGTEYIAVCLPAFSAETVHRDE
jgi:hypothetical protein